MSRNGNAMIIQFEKRQLIVDAEVTPDRVHFSWRDNASLNSEGVAWFQLSETKARLLRDFLSAWIGEQADKKPEKK